MAKVLITGGAGYIGSLLTGALLASGHEVTVVDSLMFGGESLLPYFSHPNFRFHKADVSVEALDDHLAGVNTVFHLAAIVGFPACQQVGEAVAFRYNTEATQRAFEASERAGVGRFIFASTYSNYGISPDGEPVTEESPLHPQSLYARTKIAAEEWLLERGRTSRCAPVLPRFATLFGISPRTRFDLIVNQFTLGSFRIECGYPQDMGVTTSSRSCRNAGGPIGAGSPRALSLAPSGAPRPRGSTSAPGRSHMGHRVGTARGVRAWTP